MKSPGGGWIHPVMENEPGVYTDAIPSQAGLILFEAIDNSQVRERACLRCTLNELRTANDEQVTS